MKRNLDRDLIFPIRDRASALLMRTKADCLQEAAIINDEDRTWLYSQAEGWLLPVEQAA